MEYPPTPIFPMEQKINELDIDEEVILLNSLAIKIQEIFNNELSLPLYYDQKILLGGVDKKWCGILMIMTKKY